MNIVGLWKFQFDLPSFGRLKAILDLDDTQQITGNLCLNDQFETDIMDPQYESDHLKGKVSIFGTIFNFDVNFLQNTFKGIISDNTRTIPITGVRWDNNSANKSESVKIDYLRLKKELSDRPLPSISRKSRAEIDQHVEALLSKMTIEEKIGQLNQIPGSMALIGSESDLQSSYGMIVAGKVGSVLGVWTADRAYAIQKIAVEKTRLGVPLLFMADVIHGLCTIFPIPLAMSCSWDMPIIERAASIAAVESSVSGIDLTFAPMVDIARDPRWGRVMEGAGEDPYLGACCAAAFVRGYQRENFSPPKSLLACVKHFAAYGGVEAGRDYNTVDMSEFRLRNFYLPPYKAAIDAGVASAMTSFNTILGVPSSANEYLLNTILRKEWEFKGMIISDFNAIMELVAHGVAGDEKEAAEKAIRASVDIDMVSNNFINQLEGLLAEKKVSLDSINAAVRRILYYKFVIGLFDDPFCHMNPRVGEQLLLCDEHRAIARDIARRSIVLLKNEKNQYFNAPVLPLQGENLQKIKNIAVIGPFSEERSLLGAWAAIGNINETITLKMGLISKIQHLSQAQGVQIDCQFARGCDFESESKTGFSRALEIAREADLIFLAMGEPTNFSGEARSRANLNLPGIQEVLAKEIYALGKPIVLLMFNGRPLVIPWFQTHMDSILECWFPGTEAGHAIADILFGDYNPSGKLTMSFPFAVGQIPIYYNHYSTGRPQLGLNRNASAFSNYIDIPNQPLFPFGYGLSYTTFAYSNLKLEKTVMKRGETLKVSITITNTGQMVGEEIVQLYIQDIVASVIRPVKELKGFQKIFLAPNESRTIIFEINVNMFGFYNNSSEFIVEPGIFQVFVGRSSNDCLQQTVQLVE